MKLVRLSLTERERELLAQCLARVARESWRERDAALREELRTLEAQLRAAVAR